MTLAPPGTAPAGPVVEDDPRSVLALDPDWVSTEFARMMTAAGFDDRMIASPPTAPEARRGLPVGSETSTRGGTWRPATRVGPRNRSPPS